MKEENKKINSRKRVFTEELEETTLSYKLTSTASECKNELIMINERLSNGTLRKEKLTVYKSLLTDSFVYLIRSIIDKKQNEMKTVSHMILEPVIDYEGVVHFSGNQYSKLQDRNESALSFKFITPDIYIYDNTGYEILIEIKSTKRALERSKEKENYSIYKENNVFFVNLCDKDNIMELIKELHVSKEEMEFNECFSVYSMIELIATKAIQIEIEMANEKINIDAKIDNEPIINFAEKTRLNYLKVDSDLIYDSVDNIAVDKVDYFNFLDRNKEKMKTYKSDFQGIDTESFSRKICDFNKSMIPVKEIENKKMSFFFLPCFQDDSNNEIELKPIFRVRHLNLFVNHLLNLRSSSFKKKGPSYDFLFEILEKLVEKTEDEIFDSTSFLKEKGKGRSQTIHFKYDLLPGKTRAEYPVFFKFKGSSIRSSSMNNTEIKNLKENMKLHIQYSDEVALVKKYKEDYQHNFGKKTKKAFLKLNDYTQFFQDYSKTNNFEEKKDVYSKLNESFKENHKDLDNLVSILCKKNNHDLKSFTEVCQLINKEKTDNIRDFDMIREQIETITNSFDQTNYSQFLKMTSKSALNLFLQSSIRSKNKELTIVSTGTLRSFIIVIGGKSMEDNLNKESKMYYQIIFDPTVDELSFANYSCNKKNSVINDDFILVGPMRLDKFRLENLEDQHKSMRNQLKVLRINTPMNMNTEESWKRQEAFKTILCLSPKSTVAYSLSLFRYISMNSMGEKSATGKLLDDITYLPRSSLERFVIEYLLINIYNFDLVKSKIEKKQVEYNNFNRRNTNKELSLLRDAFTAFKYKNSNLLFTQIYSTYVYADRLHSNHQAMIASVRLKQEKFNKNQSFYKDKFKINDEKTVIGKKLMCGIIDYDQIDFKNKLPENMISNYSIINSLELLFNSDEKSRLLNAVEKIKRTKLDFDLLEMSNNKASVADNYNLPGKVVFPEYKISAMERDTIKKRLLDTYCLEVHGTSKNSATKVFSGIYRKQTSKTIQRIAEIYTDKFKVKYKLISNKQQEIELDESYSDEEEEMIIDKLIEEAIKETNATFSDIMKKIESKDWRFVIVLDIKDQKGPFRHFGTTNIEAKAIIYMVENLIMDPLCSSLSSEYITKSFKMNDFKQEIKDSEFKIRQLFKQIIEISRKKISERLGKSLYHEDVNLEIKKLESELKIIRMFFNLDKSKWSEQFNLKSFIVLSRYLEKRVGLSEAKTILLFYNFLNRKLIDKYSINENLTPEDELFNSREVPYIGMNKDSVRFYNIDLERRMIEKGLKINNRTKLEFVNENKDREWRNISSIIDKLGITDFSDFMMGYANKLSSFLHAAMAKSIDNYFSDKKYSLDFKLENGQIIKIDVNNLTRTLVHSDDSIIILFFFKFTKDSFIEDLIKIVELHDRCFGLITSIKKSNINYIGEYLSTFTINDFFVSMAIPKIILSFKDNLPGNSYTDDCNAAIGRLNMLYRMGLDRNSLIYMQVTIGNMIRKNYDINTDNYLNIFGGVILYEPNEFLTTNPDIMDLYEKQTTNDLNLNLKKELYLANEKNLLFLDKSLSAVKNPSTIVLQHKYSTKLEKFQSKILKKLNCENINKILDNIINEKPYIFTSSKETKYPYAYLLHQLFSGELDRAFSPIDYFDMFKRYVAVRIGKNCRLKLNGDYLRKIELTRFRGIDIKEQDRININTNSLLYKLVEKKDDNEFKVRLEKKELENLKVFMSDTDFVELHTLKKEKIPTYTLLRGNYANLMELLNEVKESSIPPESLMNNKMSTLIEPEYNVYSSIKLLLNSFVVTKEKEKKQAYSYEPTVIKSPFETAKVSNTNYLIQSFFFKDDDFKFSNIREIVELIDITNLFKSMFEELKIDKVEKSNIMSKYINSLMFPRNIEMYKYIKSSNDINNIIKTNFSKNSDPKKSYLISKKFDVDINSVIEVEFKNKVFSSYMNSFRELATVVSVINFFNKLKRTTTGTETLFDVSVNLNISVEELNSEFNKFIFKKFTVQEAMSRLNRKNINLSKQVCLPIAYNLFQNKKRSDGVLMLKRCRGPLIDYFRASNYFTGIMKDYIHDNAEPAGFIEYVRICNGKEMYYTENVIKLNKYGLKNFGFFFSNEHKESDIISFFDFVRNSKMGNKISEYYHILEDDFDTYKENKIKKLYGHSRIINILMFDKFNNLVKSNRLSRGNKILANSFIVETEDLDNYHIVYDKEEHDVKIEVKLFTKSHKTNYYRKVCCRESYKPISTNLKNITYEKKLVIMDFVTKLIESGTYDLLFQENSLKPSKVFLLIMNTPKNLREQIIKDLLSNDKYLFSPITAEETQETEMETEELKESQTIKDKISYKEIIKEYKLTPDVIAANLSLLVNVKYLIEILVNPGEDLEDIIGVNSDAVLDVLEEHNISKQEYIDYLSNLSSLCYMSQQYLSLISTENNIKIEKDLYIDNILLVRKQNDGFGKVEIEKDFKNLFKIYFLFFKSKMKSFITTNLQTSNLYMNIVFKVIESIQQQVFKKEPVNNLMDF